MPKNINKLGERVDGWADIVLGAGDEAELARRQLEVIIKRKSFPGTLVSSEMISPSFGGQSRNFILVEMDSGATVAAYIGSFGRDLYAKWDIYVRKFVETSLVYGILGFSGIVGVILGLILGGLIGGPFGTFSFGGFLAGLFFGTSMALFPLVFFILGLGYIVKQNILGFIFKEMDEFQIDDMGALSLAIDKAMRDTLDAIGIETKALRMKEHFSAGKRERII